MYNVGIIGAGQLGSRHLQALNTSNLPMLIHVADTSEKSLTVAKERYNSLPKNNNQIVVYEKDLTNLPTTMDFVVVATGSKPRAEIVKYLLTHAEVKNLILEKVLFPKLNEYDEIGQLLKEKNIKCWVNCPRRMYGMYQDIKNRINTNETISMIFQGNNWGLCCNSIHLIDIFMYLSDEKKYSITAVDLDNEIIESKRSGYIEFYGSIMMRTPKGFSLELKCGKKGFDSIIIIKNGKNTIEIHEEEGYWKYNEQIFEYKLPFQSQLTGLLADMVLKIGYSPLTPFEDSAEYHKPFIASILNHYNKLQGINSDLCPIT